MLSKAYFLQIVVSILLIPLVVTTRWQPKNLWALIYLLFAGVAVLLAKDTYLAAVGQYNRAVGYIYIAVCVLAAVILQNRTTKGDAIFAQKTLCLVGVAYAVSTILQYFGYFVGPAKYPAHGLSGNTNITSFVLVLTLPFILKYNKWLLPLILTGIVLSNSRAGFIITGFLLLFWCFKGKKARFLIILLAIIGGLSLRMLPNTSRLANIGHYEESPRFLAIKESLPLISFFGIGHGHYRAEFGKIKSKHFEEMTPQVQFDSAHCIFIDQLIIHGVCVYALFLWLLVGLFTDKRREYRYFAFAFCGVGFFSFMTPEVLPLFWTIIGIRLGGIDASTISMRRESSSNN